MQMFDHVFLISDLTTHLRQICATTQISYHDWNVAICGLILDGDGTLHDICNIARYWSSPVLEIGLFVEFSIVAG